MNGHVRSGSAGRRVRSCSAASGDGWTTIDRAIDAAPAAASASRFRPQRPGSAQLRVLVDAARARRSGA